MTDQPTDTATLAEVREFVEVESADKGVTCPACSQFAKVYRRPLNSGMARSMITMWRAAGCDWQHVPTTVGGRSREEGKLRYWDLVEEAADHREDGGRAGYWRLTEAGEMFVLGHLFVPRYAVVYSGRLLELDGEMIGIRAALGARFDYAELMAGSRVDPSVHTPNITTERN